MHVKPKLDPLALYVGAYIAIAVFVQPQIYIAMLADYAYQTVVLPILLPTGLALYALITSPQAPLQRLVWVVRQGGLRLVAVTTWFCAGLAAFTTFKLTIPRLVPFYADPWLMRLDAFLHGGNPGRALHSVLPAWAELPLGSLYGIVWFLLWFGLMAFVALHPDARFRRRYFWAMALTVSLVGTVLACAFSSVGPIFYSEFYPDNPFSRLHKLLEQSSFASYLSAETHYLLGAYRTNAPSLGTGISAMPSMHLAIATLNANMLADRNSRLGMFGWAYVAVILFGSIYLGWHYALDSYVSIIVVTLIWEVTGRRAALREAGAMPALRPLSTAPLQSGALSPK